MPVRDFTKSVTGNNLSIFITSKCLRPSQANMIKLNSIEFRVQRYEENLDCARNNVKIFKLGSPRWGGRERGGCLPTVGRAGSSRAGRAGGKSVGGGGRACIPQPWRGRKPPPPPERHVITGKSIFWGAPGGAHGSGERALPTAGRGARAERGGRGASRDEYICTEMVLALLFIHNVDYLNIMGIGEKRRMPIIFK